MTDTKLLDYMKLPDRQHYIAEGLIAGRNGAQLGRELGITRERVRQINEKHPGNIPIPPGYFTVQRTAEILDVSVTTLYAAIYSEQISCIRYGQRWYVNPSSFHRHYCRFCGEEFYFKNGARQYCDKCVSLNIPFHFAKAKYHLGVLDKLLEKYNKDIN